jgi:hypothetical protein
VKNKQVTSLDYLLRPGNYEPGKLHLHSKLLHDHAKHAKGQSSLQLPLPLSDGANKGALHVDSALSPTGHDFKVWW